MLTICYPSTLKGQTIRGDQIPVGTVFTAKVGEYRGTFLKAYEVIVFLDNPRITWSRNTRDEHGWTIPIVDYAIRNVELRFV